MPSRISAFSLKPLKIILHAQVKTRFLFKKKLYKKILKTKFFQIQLSYKILGPEKEHESYRPASEHPSQRTQAGNDSRKVYKQLFIRVKMIL